MSTTRWLSSESTADHVCNGYDTIQQAEKGDPVRVLGVCPMEVHGYAAEQAETDGRSGRRPPPEDKEPGSASEKAIWYINRLFALEHIYSGEEPEFHENGKFRRWVKIREPLTPEEKKAERQRRSQPVLEEFYAWLDTVPPSSKGDLYKAIHFALNEKKYLTRFLEDGNIPLSNNRAESAIRPFVVGRKNWLFSATPEGAEISAMIYSIVTTAKSNGLNVEEYLEKIFSHPDAMILPW